MADLRTDLRTASVFEPLLSVAPDGEAAARFLRALRADERVDFLVSGLMGMKGQVLLAVTEARVLVTPLPPSDYRTVVLGRSQAAGVVLRGWSGAKVWVSDNAAGPGLSISSVKPDTVPRLLAALPGMAEVDKALWKERTAGRRSDYPLRKGIVGPVTPSPARASTRMPPEAAPGPARSATPTPTGRSSRPAATSGVPPKVTPRVSSAAAAGPEYTLHGGMPVRSWQDAEALTAQVMVNVGFIDAMLTPAGPDAGIDVIAKGAVGQAKYEQTVTSAPVVQALAGIASVEGAQGIFLSLAGYSAQAIAFAERSSTALFTYTESGTVTARSSAARQLIQRSQEQQADPATLRKLQRDRRSVESASEKVTVLLSQAQWLGKAVAQSQRQDRSRSGQKAQRAAIDYLNAALKDIGKVDEVPVGWQQGLLLSKAGGRLKDAAKCLGLKLPKI